MAQQKRALEIHNVGTNDANGSHILGCFLVTGSIITIPAKVLLKCLIRSGEDFRCLQDRQ